MTTQSSIHPERPSRNKSRQGQRQGWRQGYSVDLKSMQKAGLEAGTPMASLRQRLTALDWIEMGSWSMGKVATEAPVRLINTSKDLSVHLGPGHRKRCIFATGWLMCSGCPVLPERGKRNGFSCRKCRVLCEATVSSSESEGFASSDSFPHFWEPGHSNPAISNSQSSGWHMFQCSGVCSRVVGIQASSWGVQGQDGRQLKKKHSQEVY